MGTLEDEYTREQLIDMARQFKVSHDRKKISYDKIGEKYGKTHGFVIRIIDKYYEPVNLDANIFETNDKVVTYRQLLNTYAKTGSFRAVSRECGIGDHTAKNKLLGADLITTDGLLTELALLYIDAKDDIKAGSICSLFYDDIDVKGKDNKIEDEVKEKLDKQKKESIIVRKDIKETKKEIRKEQKEQQRQEKGKDSNIEKSSKSKSVVDKKQEDVKKSEGEIAKKVSKRLEQQIEENLKNTARLLSDNVALEEEKEKEAILERQPQDYIEEDKEVLNNEIEESEDDNLFDTQISRRIKIQHDSDNEIITKFTNKNRIKSVGQILPRDNIGYRKENDKLTYLNIQYGIGHWIYSTVYNGGKISDDVRLIFGGRKVVIIDKYSLSNLGEVIL